MVCNILDGLEERGKQKREADERKEEERKLEEKLEEVEYSETDRQKYIGYGMTAMVEGDTIAMEERILEQEEVVFGGLVDVAVTEETTKTDKYERNERTDKTEEKFLEQEEVVFGGLVDVFVTEETTKTDKYGHNERTDHSNECQNKMKQQKINREGKNNHKEIEKGEKLKGRRRRRKKRGK